jgi:CRP-like cAMP-binding protein
MIIKQGEVGNTFYIILDGIVNVTGNELDNNNKDKKKRNSGESKKHPSGFDEERNHKINAEAADQGARGRRSANISDQSDTSVINGVEDPTILLTPSFESTGVQLKAGDWFGEIALLTGSVRTANVAAVSPYVTVLEFDRHTCEQALGSLRDIIDKQANYRMLSVLPIIANLPDRVKHENENENTQHIAVS